MVCSRNMIRPVIAGLLLVGGAIAAPLKLVESKDQLILLNPGSWKIGTHEGRECLILDKVGEQRPPVRRPSEYALLKDGGPIGEFTVVSATLEPEATINRDICLIFGYKDDTHYYYVHVSSNSDNKFHNIIMRVDGDSRTRINKETDPEPRLANGWRTIKVRHQTNGTIQVFVDNMSEPLMTAVDTTYPVGRIGFGSFDDRAAFETLSVD